MPPRRAARSRIRRFAEIGGRRRGLLVEAAFWLLVARLTLVFVPFPALARRFGAFVPPTDQSVTEAWREPAEDDARLAAEIGWATTRAARYVPFRAVCLPQAMAARMMLGRRGVKSIIHFGAAKGRERSIDAHAWLDAAGVEVTGYPLRPEFAEIGCFVQRTA